MISSSSSHPHHGTASSPHSSDIAHGPPSTSRTATSYSNVATPRDLDDDRITMDVQGRRMADAAAAQDMHSARNNELLIKRLERKLQAAETEYNF